MNSTDSDDGKKDYPRWLRRLVLAGIGGLVVVIVYAAFNHMWSAASVGCMVAGASWMAGTLLGFLFGVPRTRAKTTEQGEEATDGTDDRLPTASAKNAYRPNTSLDEISDWLTKIIVGIGLTQLYSLAGKLNVLGLYIAQGLGGEQNKAFGLSIFMYFALCGFLFGYLWARLGILPELRIADKEDWQPESTSAVFLSKVPRFLRKSKGRQNLLYNLETADFAGEKLKSSPDFLSADEVRQLIRAVAPQERLADPFLLFQTSKQRTWLVATNQALYCILDDENTRKTGRLIQWLQPISQIQPESIRAHDYKENTGTIDIGKRTHWLYSKALHPDSNLLEGCLRDLIGRAQVI